MNDPLENQAPTSEQVTEDQGTSESAAVGEQQSEVQGTESNEQVETQDTTSSEETNTESSADNLPKPVQEQIKNATKRMHEATQEAAQLKKQLEEYTRHFNDPQYQEYLRVRQNGQLTEQLTQQNQYQVDEKDWEAAQTDPQAFTDLVNNLAGKQVEQLVKQYAPVIQDLQRRAQVADAERQIDAFASQNPDFYDIDPRVMDSAIRIASSKGGGIADAYNIAKEIEKGYIDKVQSKLRKEVESKKKAVTNTPTRTANPSVVSVSKEDALRVAMENAALGKKVEVRRK